MSSATHLRRIRTAKTLNETKSGETRVYPDFCLVEARPLPPEAEKLWKTCIKIGYLHNKAW